MYVPSHLYHMLFELFKNSLRAVVEHHNNLNCDQYPPIVVTIVRGKEDICIKVTFISVLQKLQLIQGGFVSRLNE